MFKLLEGFDFNDALENNDIISDANVIYNQVSMSIYRDEIINIFKIYNYNNITIDTNIKNKISIEWYVKYMNYCIDITNIDDKLIIYINNYSEHSVKIVGDEIIPPKIINICKEIIKCTKYFFMTTKVEVVLCEDFNTDISKFNNLPTVTLGITELYFINEFIKLNYDVVFKLNESTKYSIFKNKNIIIKYFPDNYIKQTELSKTIQYINEHYISPKTFMFLILNYDYNNIKDFNNYFFTHIDLISRFNDNYIAYDKNNVNITKNDILFVYKNIINTSSRVKKEVGFKKIISKLNDTTNNSIAKFYSRLALGIMCMNIGDCSNNVINAILFNTQIKVDLDIFKAYYNKIIDDIIQHGPIYQIMKNTI